MADGVTDKKITRGSNSPVKPVLNKRGGSFWNAYRVILAFFIGLIAIGTALLMLPISTASGQSPNFLVALFTSTSATCVTGLVVVDTGSYWSDFGHVVLLLLIQFGGLGFASGTVLLLVLLRQKPSLNQRLALQTAIGAVNRPGVLRLGFLIIKITLVIELLGALILFVGWVGTLGVGKAAWWAVFHSVSAFTGASMDLAGTTARPFVSMTDYVTNPVINLTLIGLIISGSLGFFIIIELMDWPRTHKLSVPSRLIIYGTGALLLGGAVFIWLTEHDNPQTLGALSLPEQLVAALFHSASPRTSGFNTVNLAAFNTPTLIIILALMYVGGGSGSTAGGIKVGTLIVVLASLRSVIQGRNGTVIMKRTIPARTIEQALVVSILYAFGIVFFTFLATISENLPVRALLFEITSAFGTVGLSLGITPQLSEVGRVLLIMAMFVGRLGPFLLVLALSDRADSISRVTYPEEDMAIG